MTKIVLEDLASIQNDPTAVDTLNDNFDKIVVAFENTLSRNGQTPNQMESNLDMNGNRILNLPRPMYNNEPARLKDIGNAYQYAEDAKHWAEVSEGFSEDSEQAAIASAASAVDADDFAQAASASASNAATSETNAATSAANALTSENNAKTSEDNAKDSEDAAALSESNAAGSASDASGYASAAATSAANALTSENNAATSETNAGISETNAAQSLSDFQDEYLGPLASDPVGSYSEGTLYWNTTTNALMIYDGASWVAYNPSAAGVQSVVAGANITVDNTDPLNPVVSSTASGGGFYISDIAPSSPEDGDRWLDSTSGIEYTWIVDADSSQWVETGPNGVVIPEVDPWAQQPVGVPIPLLDSLVGVSNPPTNLNYRYIKLTASDSYNTGVLTSESVSGSAPLVVATAVISLSGSPINGETVNLINTERRFLRAGSSGTVENDQMQQITGAANALLHASSTVPLIGSVTGAIGLRAAYGANYISGQAAGPTIQDGIDFNSANSPNARTGTETRSKNIGVTYFMRIK